jgi:hypothetical protein
MLLVMAASLGCWQHQQHHQLLGWGVGGPVVVVVL